MNAEQEHINKQAYSLPNYLLQVQCKCVRASACTAGHAHSDVTVFRIFMHLQANSNQFAHAQITLQTAYTAYYDCEI